MPPLVSPRKEAWETSAEFPYWRCVTTKIWLVLLIGRAAWEFDSANQKHYPDLGRDASPVWCSFLRSHFRRETSSDVAKFRQFSLARINYAKQWDNKQIWWWMRVLSLSVGSQKKNHHVQTLLQTFKYLRFWTWLLTLKAIFSVFT